MARYAQESVNRNMVPGTHPNPEGAKQLSFEAMKKSAMADSKESHKTAADAHRKAAEEHYNSGDLPKSSFHFGEAHKHNEAAKSKDPISPIFHDWKE